MPSLGATRFKKGNFGTVSDPAFLFGQDPKQLKKECLRRRLLFVDEMFPPDKKSIGNMFKPEEMDRIIWKRPKDICKDGAKPAFIVSGVSRFDFMQGELGDCWLLACIGAVTFQEVYISQVIPEGQSFDEDYCGLFHFRFWRYGSWLDVVIDDKLATKNDRLVFVHSKDPTEFWPALLEKAYAKVCGSYADMNDGTPAEAMVDFTGGVHLSMGLSKPTVELWETMCHAYQSKSLMGCGTPQGKTSANTVLANELVQGHAYTVTGVKLITVSQGTGGEEGVKLVRLWNPWGDKEWTGDWCDSSPKWETVIAKDKKYHTKAIDGEFWMSLDDFCVYFGLLDICFECPKYLDGNWNTSVYEGRWVAGTTAGGHEKNTETFWTNPQYRVKVEESPERSKTEGDKNMLVSLMQKPDKRNRRMVKNINIGFYIYEVPKEFEGQKGRFPASFFSTHRFVAFTDEFSSQRDVMLLVSLKPGEYLIVPCSFYPNKTASFILTIISKEETHVHAHSGGHNHELMEGKEPAPFKSKTHKERQALIRQLSEKYETVHADLLQKILNEEVLQVKTGGFSVEACRSMVALLDISLSGELNSQEFVALWNKVNMFKDDFIKANVSGTGALSETELQEALAASGEKVSADIVKLIVLRYGAPPGKVTLVNFILLALRLDCMKQFFRSFSEGTSMSVRKHEWLFLTMYN